MNYYNTIAKSYNTLHQEEQEAKVQIIKRLIKPQKNELLLDVGCGSGLSSNWSCSVVGIDPSEKLITIARKTYPQNTFLIGHAEDMPFQDHYFDYVICVSALHHCDVKNALNEMRRVGKNTFVFSLVNKSSHTTSQLKIIRENFPFAKTVKNQHDTIIFCSYNKHFK